MKISQAGTKIRDYRQRQCPPASFERPCTRHKNKKEGKKEIVERERKLRKKSRWQRLSRRK